jgi:restriction endonuclease S subunit
MFLVSSGALENRLDATAYKLVFNFNSVKFDVQKLSNIAFINPKTVFDKLDSESEISFVPMEVIDEKNGMISNFQTKKVKDTKGFTRFQENDLIWAKITPCMQNGKSAIVRNILQGYACGSTEFFIIRPKSEKLLIDYVHILLRDDRILENAQNFFGGSAGQQRVSIDYLKNLKIPIPPLSTQTQIVQLFAQAYESKKAKEAEAKRLLAGIDAYLLEKLGIPNLSGLEDLTGLNRHFFVKFSQVQGKRFDPKKYVPENQALLQSLQTTKFEKISLKYLCIQSVAGDWGIDNAEIGFEERLVIRATEFDNLYNLNLENDRVKYRFISKIKLAKMDLQIGDLLIEKSGGSIDQPVGRIAIITEEFTEKYKLAYSNFIHKIRIDSNKINSDYLFAYLKTLHNIKITDIMQSQTNGIRNLIMQEYLNISIPLPPLSLQTEIASHISTLRAEAKRLEKEAKEEIEKAKKEVERLILG